MNRVSRSRNPQTFKIFRLFYLTEFNQSNLQVSAELATEFGLRARHLHSEANGCVSTACTPM